MRCFAFQNWKEEREITKDELEQAMAQFLERMLISFIQY